MIKYLLMGAAVVAVIFAVIVFLDWIENYAPEEVKMWFWGIVAFLLLSAVFGWIFYNGMG